MRFNDRAMALAGIPDLPIDAFKKEGGKIKLHGGGGGPTTTRSETSNIPEYAREYVDRMMGATEKQIYKYGPKGQITGFQPFQSYSEYAQKQGGTGETVAGFTPMQARAMQGIGEYQMPGQTGAATGFTGAGILGSMGAGANYAQQATDPSAMQSYMSPYVQNALAPQMREVARQSAIEGQRQQAQAAQAGAFGGSRQGLVEAERQRNLMQQQSDIYGKGMQSAFEQARQAQQFGSELGLKGYGQALQGAGQLGALGEQQYKQELGLLGQQYDVGAKQQAYEQNRLNQIIQDYATKQQYPFIQLGTLSNMLRGLPMQASTTQLYQAQPSMLQQGIGLAGAYANLSQAGVNPFGRKEGGEIKEMASGGIATVDPYKLPSMMKKLSDDQLSEKMGGDTDPETMGIAQAEKQRRDHIRGNAPKMAGGDAVAFKEGGTKIDQIKNPMLDDSEGSKKEEPSVATRPKAAAPKPAPVEKSSYQAEFKAAMNQPSPAAPEIAELRKQRDETKTEIAGGIEGQMARRQAVYDKLGINPREMYAQEKAEQQRFLEQAQGDARKAEALRYAQMWAKFGSTPGPVLKAALTAINETVPDLLDDQDKARMVQRSIRKTMFDLDKAEYLEKKGDVDKAAELDNAAKGRAAEMTLKLGTLLTTEFDNKMKLKGELAKTELSGETEIAKTRIQEGMRANAEAARDARAEKKAEAAIEKQKSVDTSRALKYLKDELKDYEDKISTAKTILNSGASAEDKARQQAVLDEYKKARVQKIKEAKALYEYADVDKLLGGEAPAAPAAERKIKFDNPEAAKAFEQYK